jgi:hypothetical protein
MYGWSPAAQRIVALADEALSDTAAVPVDTREAMHHLASVIVYKVRPRPGCTQNGKPAHRDPVIGAFIGSM